MAVGEASLPSTPAARRPTFDIENGSTPGAYPDEIRKTFNIQNGFTLKVESRLTAKVPDLARHAYAPTPVVLFYVRQALLLAPPHIGVPGYELDNTSRLQKDGPYQDRLSLPRGGR